MRCAPSARIRVLNGRIAAIGDLAPEPGEEIVDASGCVIYPGLVSTATIICFIASSRVCAPAMNLPLMGLGALGPAFLLA